MLLKLLLVLILILLVLLLVESAQLIGNGPTKAQTNCGGAGAVRAKRERAAKARRRAAVTMALTLAGPTPTADKINTAVERALVGPNGANRSVCRCPIAVAVTSRDKGMGVRLVEVAVAA